MFEELATTDSFIHGLDPRGKLVVVFLFSIVVAAANRFQVLLGALTLGLLIVLAAKVPARVLIKRLIPVNVLILFLWLFLPFTFGGEPLFFMGSLAVTREGVFYATRISIKSNAMMLMLIALVASTPIFSMGHAMHQLKITKNIVHLFFFTYRYIHTIYKEYLRLKNSIKIRGFIPKTDLHTYKTFAHMFGMLLVRSFDRAHRVHNAMLCRGFKGDLYSLKKFSFKTNDIVSIIFMTAMIVIMGVMEWIRII
ncbi:MAG: cobalt ECF transporter T component CbiQ [Deltaproteobacteria bacterium]|nr:cobalt ECF transporter T component CbiQ [Deltaproteobacteria bacterium]